MQNPPQLDPVQAWLLGHIDTATLRDRCDCPAVAEKYGRALSDENFALELIAGVA